MKQTRMRVGIGRRMSESKQQIPHFYVQTEIVVDGILDALERSANGGRRASVTSVLIHGAAASSRGASRVQQHLDRCRSSPCPTK